MLRWRRARLRRLRLAANRQLIIHQAFRGSARSAAKQAGVVVYGFLPSPRWGEGLGVRGEAPATSQLPPHPNPLPRKAGGEGDKGEAHLGPSGQMMLSTKWRHAHPWRECAVAFAMVCWFP